ncbi:hypothetical protein GQ651_00650 [Alphaproteobacteria bacterium GH1-50]|uniref:Cardiolipin synthase N-terminal domain-containing protein n=1 Tax=Kangsaoukella pontilimi TaxID=2691042 RepID=A0A7C9IDZ0_9RHOB|nr:PLDc N-terminal domain-containing protein [Kangsaoukella pontilimi]MXQ06344.1 hypothetical protein [Kangsaoukella pontilimi]
MTDYFGLLQLFIISLALWGLTDVWRSGRSMGVRLIWSAVLILPIFGFIAWFLIGPRATA